MKRKLLVLSVFIATIACSLAFKDGKEASSYRQLYNNRVNKFITTQQELISLIDKSNVQDTLAVAHIRTAIQKARIEMKGLDFWTRYLEPVIYKKVNSPLPVEWETEVFEKFEAPYKRDGGGSTLATLDLDEEQIDKAHLRALIDSSLVGTRIYLEDSITRHLENHHHFYLCNRLYILNLAAIYTTGFECPEPEQVIPELRIMMSSVKEQYKLFNESFPTTKLTNDYLALYDSAIAFVHHQNEDLNAFDHYTFLRNYINPLFTLNQQLIKQYRVISRSNVDYSLNKEAISIFDKNLYNGQQTKGIFLRVKDTAVLNEIDRLGKLLFYDPILSGNNMRSCASCHKPDQYFTDTAFATALKFDRNGGLPRNTPSLINADYNHLIMADGAHYTLQHQTKAVMLNMDEMGSVEADIVKKVMSCKTYKDAFKKLLVFTPQEPEVSMIHISSAITYYYGKFSKSYAPFDEAMNEGKNLSHDEVAGFNLFMSKAQCATCHFVPQFNGVKPPYIGSEFEVLGVPADTLFAKLSADKGPHNVNPAKETMNAFRTGSVRNAAHTMPYMHNGVFRTIDQVIEFYNNGGGAGRGLTVDNQTLSADSLHLTVNEKRQLVAFINTLNERIPFDRMPELLLKSRLRALHNRKPGGIY